MLSSNLKPTLSIRRCRRRLIVRLPDIESGLLASSFQSSPTGLHGGLTFLHRLTGQNSAGCQFGRIPFQRFRQNHTGQRSEQLVAIAAELSISELFL